ncbi:MAG TPA: phosphoribosyltransferase family protein [Candidatus Saccharimonadales bacterium]|nr:phosphoribosyltransferase family protein [Candidatus Saccharimonadales bacterium]
MHYIDRTAAGRRLALELAEYYDKDVVVVALTPGAVLLGAEIAQGLHGQLVLRMVGKVQHPYDPGYTIGALPPEGPAEYTYPAMDEIDPLQLKKQLAYARSHVRINELLYDPFANDPHDVHGKTVVVVDDLVSSGLTMRVALESLATEEPKELVVAVTVATVDGLRAIRHLASRIVALERPRFYLGRLGHYYVDSSEPDVSTVRRLLRAYHTAHHPGAFYEYQQGAKP